jgi:hypothetical protein
LLENWRNIPSREDISWKQQHWNPIDGGRSSARNHIGSTRANRRSAGERAQSIVHFREGHGSVHHGLLVPGKVIGEVGILLQRLSNSSYVTVAENSEATCEERGLPSVSFDKLIFQEQDNGLSHRHSTLGRQTASSMDL